MDKSASQETTSNVSTSDTSKLNPITGINYKNDILAINSGTNDIDINNYLISMWYL